MKENTQKVFISYIHEEAPLAHVLKEWIVNSFKGQIEVFVSSDIKDIPAGKKWLYVIKKALKESKAFIVLCSPNSITRRWINIETGCAWIRDIPVLPICHSGQSKVLPNPLSEYQALSTEDPDFIDGFLISLVQALELEEMPRIYKASILKKITKALDSFQESAQKTVPDLLSDLKYGQSSPIRRKAAEALGKTGRPEVLPDLLDATEDKWSPGVRDTAKMAIGEILGSHRWELIHQQPNFSKEISFLSNYSIGEGRNENEHTWRIQDRKLELIREDDRVQSRFGFDKETQRFIHTNDPDTLSLRNQVIHMV